MADVLDSGQTNPYGAPLAAFVVDPVVDLAVINAGRPDLEAERATFLRVRARPILRAEVCIEQRRHVFDWVVGLEVSGEVGDVGVADAVRLIEGVTGKGFDQIKDCLGVCSRIAALLRPGDKAIRFRGHDLRHLLAHRLADNIRSAKEYPANRWAIWST